MKLDRRVWHKKQVEQYAKESPIYKAYADALSEILKRACKAYAPLAIVEARAKSLSSFAEKAMRKAHKHDDPVHQLTDLCGTRVITQTQSEVERICTFIRENFRIDEANSEDKLKELGPTQFGYLSTHYIVQMKEVGTVLGVTIPREIGERKAEIQVRTLLQHTWAGISHDRIYKNQFEIPDKWQRDAARLAAVLEETDREFTRFVKGLDVYAVNYGAYMTKQQMEDKVETLSVILENEQDDKQKELIALRIARIAKAAGDWPKIIEILKEYKKTKNPSILREIGSALCRSDNPDYKEGEKYLEEAISLDSADEEAYTSLAWLWEKQKDEKKARKYYAKAFELKPSNPYYLAAFLEYEISRRQYSSLALLQPLLCSAIEVCRAHADVKIELPWAFFTMGKFHLLLDEPYNSLGVYTKAIQLSLSEGSGIPEGVLDNEINSLNRLRSIEQSIRGYEWVRRLLLLARSIKSSPDKPLDDVKGLALKTYKGPESIVIVAGACNEHGDEYVKAYQELLVRAFEGFRGIIISSGTTAGISGVVGYLSEEMKKRGKREFQIVGYVPRLTPAHVTLDKRYDELIETEGIDFSAFEPLQMWIDLLTSGVKPSQVKLLGINGGEIAAFEYRLALALGASVAILTGRGGATSDLERDEDWRTVGNLLPLPLDAMTIRAFVSSRIFTMKPEDIERAAKAAHEKYREANWHKLVDPSMLPWEELKDYLQESNRQQMAYAEEILRQMGYGVRPAPKENIKMIKFTKDEVEKMGAMEHGRWNVERIKAGCRLGPRDPLKKISSYLVPWSKLPEEVKEYDLKAVRDFPYIFREVGLEVYRLKSRKPQ